MTGKRCFEIGCGRRRCHTAYVYIYIYMEGLGSSGHERPYCLDPRTPFRPFGAGFAMESRCPSCSGLRWPSYDSAGSASFAFPTYTDFCNCRSRYDQQPTGSEDFTCAGLLGRTRGSSGYAMSNYELCTPQAFPEAVQPQGPEEEVLCIEVMPVQADGTEITE